MPKICQKTSCDRFVFSHGYCKVHQYLRKDDKWVKQLQKRKQAGTNSRSTQSGRSVLPSVSKKQQIINNKIHDNKQDLIRANGQTCFFCGGFANDYMHIFPKSLFPEYVTEKWNGVLSCRDHHTIFDDYPGQRHKLQNIMFLLELILCVDIRYYFRFIEKMEVKLDLSKYIDDE